MANFEERALTTQSLLNALPNGVALIRDDGTIDATNQFLDDIDGYGPEELVGRPFQQLLSPELDALDLIATSRRRKGTLNQRSVATLVRHDLSEISIELVLSTLAVGNSTWTLASIRDNTAEQEDEATRLLEERHANDVGIAAANALAQSEMRFRVAFEGNMAPMVFSDQRGIFLAVNDAYCTMTGRPREELLGKDSKHFTHPDDIGLTESVYQQIISGVIDQARYDKRFLHKDGTILSAEVSFCSVRDDDGSAHHFISSVRDVTEERALAAQLSFQALHEPLTGLANRALFEDHLSQAHARVTRLGGFAAVLLLDLDDFKVVNDDFGHLIGDQLLIQIARRFEALIRPSDTLCRFGGDEFLYLAEGLDAPEEAEQIARRLLDSLKEPFTFGTITIEQHASVGVVTWDASQNDEEEIVQNADAAMYEAKRRGRDHYVVFTPTIQHSVHGRVALLDDLRLAISTDELIMHFQPIIDLLTGNVVGFEALMRWPHPVRGMVPPNVFIPLAEQNGLTLDLGAFALRTALTAANSWKPANAMTCAPFVTVNLTALQFHDVSLVPMIVQELKQSKIAPERLFLEVTEGTALSDFSETMTIREKLSTLGVCIALDGYGIGNSSLSHLAALNPRMIKIDQSFVRPKHDNERSDMLLEAIVTLSNKLGMIVLAEGIETPAQLDRLHHLDCDLGQGFLWSPAVSAEEAATILERHVVV